MGDQTELIKKHTPKSIQPNKMKVCGFILVMKKVQTNISTKEH